MSKQVVELFSRLEQVRGFREYLQAESEAPMKVLKLSRDLTLINQAQGKLQLIDEMLDLLKKSKIT